MLRGMYPRDGLQGSARRPIVLPGDTGRNAYGRLRSLRRQAITQTDRASVRPGDDPAAEGHNERNIEEAEAAVLQEYEIIDLTNDALSQAPQNQTQSHGRYRYKQVLRNAPLESSHRERSAYRFGEIDLRLGTCVELRVPCGNWKIKFVEIKSIWASKTDGSVTIRGLPYTRNCDLSGMLEKVRNEVCQILEIDADDARRDEAQALFEIRPEQVLRARTLNKTNALLNRTNRLLKKTNTPHPDYRFGGDRQWWGKTDLEREEQAPLTCREKFRVQYQDSRFRKKDKPETWGLVSMTEAEADEPFRVPDKELRVNWRGITRLGGSHKPQFIHLDGPETPTTRKDRQYTYADIFCGAGGASRGADMAGLKLVYGVDFWPVSCATWRRNFPGAHMFEQDATDFIQNGEIDYLSHPIDILHLSPPCQFWSPLAYPHAGRNNEANMAILFACSELIKKVRPRLFTLEQTFGLTHDTHTEFLNALVQGFKCNGYSVQWKIVPLVEYGLPQTRRRLIMIGSCPGEQLPPWPPATHSATPAPGLKPFVTEAQAIRNLSGGGVSLHDVASTIARNEPPRDGNEPFSKTITCGGTQGTYHFSGRRDWTLREIACLQGFPVFHQFEGNKTAIKKQIGNAFPPCVVKAFYDYLRAWLRHVDGIQSLPSQARLSVPQRRTIRPSVGRRRRQGVQPPVSSIEPRHHVNGDLDDHEALALALQESRHGARPPPATSAAIIEISDENENYSPVSAVAPLLERMSIAPADIQPKHNAGSPLQSRSRSVTLDFSPSPSPGPGRRGAPSQKRSLDSMHDGEGDEVMEEESPPKRERVRETGDHDNGALNDDRIPSGLLRYAGPRDAQGADDENIVVGRLSRGQNETRNTHADGSGPEDRDPQRRTHGDDIPPRRSAIDWSSVLARARVAGNSGNELWTF